MVELWRWRTASELTQSWIPEMLWAWFWSPICHLVADISKHILFCHHHHSTDPFSGVYWDLCSLSHLSHQPHTQIKLRNQGSGREVAQEERWCALSHSCRWRKRRNLDQGPCDSTITLIYTGEVRWNCSTFCISDIVQILWFWCRSYPDKCQICSVIITIC